MIKRIVLILALVLLPIPRLDAQQICDRRVNVDAAASTTTEIVAASAGTTVRVCGFVLGSVTAGAVQFMSSGQAVSGVIFIPSGGSVSFGAGDSIAIMGTASANLQLSVGTIPVAGFVLYYQGQ